MQNALNEYLRWGGFPEVVLADEEARKEALLKQYFEDVLFKDLALRHQIRDLSTLRSLAVHLLTQTTSLVSLQRVAGIFGVSLDLARAYCGYLEEAFLVTFLPLLQPEDCRAAAPASQDTRRRYRPAQRRERDRLA